MNKRLTCLTASILALWLSPASAQFFGELNAIEFRNTQTGHYFLTADPDEIAAFDSGRAGPGWGRTGTRVQPMRVGGSCADCPPVERFYRPKNNTHFLTADPGEIEVLKTDPGLIHEGTAFLGKTRRNGPAYEVYRFYNNRPDNPNHRYVPGVKREAMLAKGWIDEGVAFVMPFADDDGLKQVSLGSSGAWTTNIRSIEECKKAGNSTCLTTTNLAPADVQATALGGGFFGISGPVSMKFVANGRSASDLTNAGPYRPLGSEAFRPFGPFAVDTELNFSHTVNLRSAQIDANSHVYGHPTLEYVDSRSGLPLNFSVLSFGHDPAADYLGRDALSGAVIVGTTHRESSPYLKNLQAETFRLGESLQSQPPALQFSFTQTRAEFQHVLEQARKVEPALSADPADYVLTGLRYKNEIAGNGSIETLISPMGVQVRENRR